MLEILNIKVQYVLKEGITLMPPALPPLPLPFPPVPPTAMRKILLTADDLVPPPAADDVDSCRSSLTSAFGLFDPPGVSGRFWECSTSALAIDWTEAGDRAAAAADDLLLLRLREDLDDEDRLLLLLLLERRRRCGCCCGERRDSHTGSCKRNQMSLVSEFPSLLLLPTSLGQPMYGQLALKELPSPNLAPFLLLNRVHLIHLMNTLNAERLHVIVEQDVQVQLVNIE